MYLWKQGFSKIMAARVASRTRTARRSTSTRRVSTAKRATTRKPAARRTVARKPAKKVVRRPAAARRTAVRKTAARRPTAARRTTVRRAPARKPTGSASTRARRIQAAKRMGIISVGPHSHLKQIKTARRVVPRAAPKKRVGTISHYFNKIGVAVIETSHRMQAGERVSIEGATTNFKQKVRSMQHNNKKIEVATRGKSIGLKVNHKVRRKDIVYRI